MLSNKQVLARILLECVSEFKDCPIEDIVNKYIEGEPEVDAVPVFDKAPLIRGMNTEDNSESEGLVNYDVLFRACSPTSGEHIQLIINVESQNKFTGMGYPLLKRAVYYTSRLISSQKNIEFQNDHYGDIKKVYSIWICSHQPEQYTNTIREVKFGESVIYGSKDTRLNKEDYDMISIILICLDVKEAESDQENKLLHLLNLLFNEYLKSEEIKSEIKEGYNLTMANELKGGI